MSESSGRGNAFDETSDGIIHGDARNGRNMSVASLRERLSGTATPIWNLFGVLRNSCFDHLSLSPLVRHLVYLSIDASGTNRSFVGDSIVGTPNFTAPANTALRYYTYFLVCS